MRLAMRTFPAVFAALLAGAGCERFGERNVEAVGLAARGTVTVQKDRYSPETPIKENAHLALGTIVRTEADSRVSIALLPNALVQLAENTKLEILSLTLAKDGNETDGPMGDRFVQVKLWRGAAFFSHIRPDTARAELRISTSQGEAMTGSGALFKLDTGNHHARLTSVSGQILFRVEADVQATQIPPGNIGEWNSGKATLVPAETDRIGQQDVLEAVDVEQQLRDLARRRQDVLPR